jgi:putative transposase
MWQTIVGKWDVPRSGYLFVEKRYTRYFFCPVGATLENKNVCMANVYSQLYIHGVFAVKYRAAVIQPVWEERLHKYITGIVQNNGHKMLSTNSVPDHLHMFFGLSPAQSISDVMRLVKGDSSEFINKHQLTPAKFQWQEGYGAFSNSRSQIDTVVKYVINQKEHHQKKTFREEYIKILSDYEVEYDEKYLFHDLI